MAADTCQLRMDVAHAAVLLVLDVTGLSDGLLYLLALGFTDRFTVVGGAFSPIGSLRLAALYCLVLPTQLTALTAWHRSPVRPAASRRMPFSIILKINKFQAPN